jgi:hypothetical protein
MHHPRSHAIRLRSAAAVAGQQLASCG